MSEFSEKCKYYLVESGSNVYQLSQAFNLNRTSLQRMITDKRLPAPEFVLKFCDCLRINKLQKEELLELYMIEKIGKNTFNNRKCISHVLEYLTLMSSHTEPPTLYSSRTLPPPFTSTNFSYSVEKNVAEFLEGLFSSDTDTSIYCNLPPTCSTFFNLLNQLYMKYGKSFAVTHLFTMRPNPSADDTMNRNLEILYSILPVIFSDYEGYAFFYYYSRITTADLTAVLYPYYIITGSTVILLSSDLSVMLYLAEPSAVEAYTQNFEQILSYYTPLLRRTSSLESLLTDYSDLNKETGATRFALEAHPCIMALFYSAELVHAIFEDDDPKKEWAITFFQEQQALYGAMTSPFVNFFTEEGLAYFVKNGKLCGHYELLGFYFTPAQRSKMLRNLLDQNPSFYQPYLLKKGFPCSKNFHLELFNNWHSYLLYLNSKQNFFSVTLPETSIGLSFEDFFKSLPETDFVYPEAEMREIIETYICLLEAGEYAEV